MRSASEATLLRQAAEVAAETETFEEALQQCVDIVCESSGWPVGHVYIPADDNPAELAPTSIWHLAEADKYAVFCEITEQTRFALGKGLPGRIAATRKPAWVSNVQADDNFRRNRAAGNLGVKGAFGFPIEVGGDLVAVLEFFTDEEIVEDQNMLRLMDTVGHQVGRVLERQRARIDLQGAKDAAEAANVSKTEFLANMSHELRTPMNSIMGFTQRLLKKLSTSLDERDLDALNTVDRNAKHLLRLINDVLDLSKIEAGKMELNGMEFDLRDAVQEVVERSRSLVDAKPIELEIELPAEPVSVFADPVKIAQIITNLLSNAVRYTEQGKVVISVERVDDSILGRVIALRVADTGMGIKEEDMAGLFDKFTQVDSSTTRQVGGTGLGSAITGQLVELHGGRIDVQSVYGSGSTFTCIFPIAVPEPGIDDQSPTHSVSAGDRLTVLCVDDEPDILKFMKLTLEDAGYEAVLATNYDLALRQAERRRPDLICLDIHMPGKSGVDVIQALKASPLLADIPVLVVSAHNERAAMIQLGARGFLGKPVDEETFVSAIHDILVQQLGSVLIVEDDDDTAKLLKNSVSDYGIEVHVAGNGEEALAHLANHRPSVMVVDLVMPVMNGFELIERLEQTPSWATIPVVVCSGMQLHASERERLHSANLQLIQKGEGGTQRLQNAMLKAIKKCKIKEAKVAQ